MSFKMPAYTPPDFSAPIFAAAPDAALATALANGVVPENYHATSIFPEYFKVNGRWLLAEDSRMDSVAVLRSDDTIAVIEFRNIQKGDRVFTGRTEDGSQGIYVHAHGFNQAEDSTDTFAFRTGRSRETAYSQDYDMLYERLNYERKHGNILWVLGPACSFDADAREAMSSLIHKGYAQGLLAGNALATHDLEAAALRTALGQNIYTQRQQPNGHYNHLDIINGVRNSGSISAYITEKNIDNGIIHACVTNNVPFVLAGSIRDDGPLPEVYGDVYAAQNAMRDLTRKATTVICVATQLHSIATGNMTPSFRVQNGVVRPVFFYSVDISEFAVNKLRDRGSLSVTSFVTNVQDFLVHVARGVE